jgi:hypothetical protein
MAASIHANLQMIPRESVLLAVHYEHISLGSFVRHGHCEGFCASGAMVCPLLVVPDTTTSTLLLLLEI